MRRGLVDPDADYALKRELAQRLDSQAILDHYGAENSYEQFNAEDGSTEVVHSCLIDRVRPHHMNGDQNPSASCNLERGLYVCYSYTDPETGKSGMDMISLVMLLEGKKFASDVVDLLNPYLSGSTQDSDTFREQLLALFDADKGDAHGEVFRTYGERTLASWAFVHPYLATRGISEQTASRLQIGYDHTVNRITIPHFVRGALVGWQKRAIPAGCDDQGPWPATEPAIPKYKNSPGFPKSTSLYRFDQAQLSSSGRLIVVESPFSVIKADSLGLGINDPVVATFGAKVTDEQIVLMRDYQQVVLWMDDDSAGFSATLKVMRALAGHTEVRVVNTDVGMDLGDYDDIASVREKIDTAILARDLQMEMDLWATKSRV